jgi:hypothetical protein
VLPYFPSVQNALNTALGRLYSHGEIHITDTNFYSEGEVDGAVKRCVVYYDMMGFPQMAGNYHHHTLSVLKDFKTQVLYNPGSILNRLGKKEPFYWVRIKN